MSSWRYICVFWYEKTTIKLQQQCTIKQNTLETESSKTFKVWDGWQISNLP